MDAALQSAKTATETLASKARECERQAAIIRSLEANGAVVSPTKIRKTWKTQEERDAEAEEFEYKLGEEVNGHGGEEKSGDVKKVKRAKGDIIKPRISGGVASASHGLTSRRLGQHVPEKGPVVPGAMRRVVERLTVDDDPFQ